MGPHSRFWDWKSCDFNARPLHTRTSKIVKSEKEEKWDPIWDFETRGVRVSNTIQQQTITFEKVKRGRRYDQYIRIFRFWNFASFDVQTSTWKNLRKGEKVEFWGLLTPDAKHHTSPNVESYSYEEVKVWALQIRVSGFTKSQCKKSHITKRQIAKLRKGKGVGPTNSGYGVY